MTPLLAADNDNHAQAMAVIFGLATMLAAAYTATDESPTMPWAMMATAILSLVVSYLVTDSVAPPAAALLPVMGAAAVVRQSLDDATLLIDSGSAAHVTPYKSDIMPGSFKRSRYSAISVASGTTAPLLGEGDVAMEVQDDGGHTHVKVIHGVLVVPDAIGRILSVDRVVAKGSALYVHQEQSTLTSQGVTFPLRPTPSGRVLATNMIGRELYLTGKVQLPPLSPLYDDVTPDESA